jgi:radical SAM protein with 4Fe4S-binding SPASM domain
VRRQLAARGGNASGVAIANVDARGDVHPDQFWPHVTLGNVRERPLSAIWSDPSHPVLAALRDRRRHLGGRCPECPYFPLCRGGNRVRAEMLTGDRWAPDPGCHLTDAELGLSNGAGRHERSGDEAYPEPARGRGADHVPRDCADLEIDRR